LIDGKLLRAIIMLFLLAVSGFYWPGTAAAQERPLVYVLRVDGTVTAGTAGYLMRGIGEADSRADAVIILLDTPGGLVTATLDIIQLMEAAEIPVITMVHPRGAIAASAGTFILVAGDAAVMAPGTTCGAAMPVTVGTIGQEPQAADQKTINFLAGHMKSIAREKGRPEDVAERFVTENLTLTAEEARELGIIDLITGDMSEMLEQLHGREVATGSGPVVFNTANAKIEELSLNFSEKLVNILSDPALAGLFIMLGMYGLIIGFSSPGYFLPEVLGAILLVTGLYGAGLFQVNVAAVLLIVLGVGMLIAEAFTPTYGVLGTGGVVGIVLGMVLFPSEPLMPAAWFVKLKVLAIGTGVISAVLVIVILMGILRLRRLKPMQDEREFFNTEVYVINDLDPQGQVKIRGEIWSARSRGGEVIKTGQKVRVAERQGIMLIVESEAEISEKQEG
jgi:membrane-bound serine protease (ClpP class)